MILIPHPKQINLEKITGIPNGVSEIEIDKHFSERLMKTAGRLLDKTVEGRKLIVVKDNSLKRVDEYKLEFKRNDIILAAREERSAFYGLCTLNDLSQNGPLDLTGFIKDWADLEMRILMIDLKRLGWNFDYLMELIVRIAERKINYIMIEYEDKFKYDFCDVIPVESAFTKEQLTRLEMTAYENYTCIIPLVQPLGHFEYILCHKKYEHLKEIPDIISQACPLKPGTFELFTHMAGEVMAMHPSSDYFHIGGDEPFLLGTCPKCAERKKSVGNGRLYTDYINQILNWTLEKGKTPLMWADILEHYDEAAETCSKEAIVVDWSYRPVSLRGYDARFGKFGIPRMSYEIFSACLSSEQKEKYEKYFLPDQETKTVETLPFGSYLKDLGFEVLSGSNINSTGNVLTHSEACVKHGLKGHLATYWGAPDSVRPPYTVYETRWAGACMLAASGWNLQYELDNRDNYFQRFAAFHCGSEKASMLCAVINNTTYLIPPNTNNDNDHFSDLDRLIAVGKELNRQPSPYCDVDLMLNFIEKIKLEKELEKFKRTILAKPFFPAEAYEKINIEPYCNVRFEHKEAIPGWSRRPMNDLRFFPKGKGCFNGVPFYVIPDHPDGGHSAIMFGSYYEIPGYPKDINGVVVGKKIEYMNFLHAAIEGKPKNGYYGRYILHYEDGDCEEIDLIYQKNIGSWWHIIDAEDASVAWKDWNPDKRAKTGLFTYIYQVKRKDVKITSIDMICESNSLLAVAAITVTLAGKDLKKGKDLNSIKQIDTLRAKFVGLKEKMGKNLDKYLSKDGIDEVFQIGFDYNLKFLEDLSGMYV